MKPLPDHTITVHLASTTLKEGKALFMVAYHDLDFEVTNEDKIRDVLDGGIKGSLLNALGKLSKHTQITLGEYPGRHFEYAGNRFDQKIQATSRIFLVDRRLYQITVIRAPEADVTSETTKFFDSFKLVRRQNRAGRSLFERRPSTAKICPRRKAQNDGGEASNANSNA
jgi:hypothetical protein